MYFEDKHLLTFGLLLGTGTWNVLLSIKRNNQKMKMRKLLSRSLLNSPTEQVVY